MITQSTTIMNMPWQQQLSNAITNPRRLLEILELPEELLSGCNEAILQFPLKVPMAYLNRIKKGCIEDPLLKQILPMHAETLETKGYLKDALGEKQSNKAPGLLHKYQGRALLLFASTCAIDCRYCFRRHFPYEDNRLSETALQQTLTYLKKDSSIKEVILSGGDPLVNNDKRIAWLVEKLGQIPHIKRLRVHSRLPVVLPDRITHKLLSIFSSSRLQVIMVIHCNHAQEIDISVQRACGLMQEQGVRLLNQSVLLKGVNDCTSELIELSEALIEAQVMPYYLHLTDKVQGTAHFDVSEPIAQRLVGEMLKKCSGYLVPKLVKEIPYQPCKIPINPLLN